MKRRQVMIAMAGGLLAGVLAAPVPTQAQNPMTPVRPIEPEKSAGAPATPAAGAAEPRASPPTAPASASGDVGSGDAEAVAPPRARGRGRSGRAVTGIQLGRWEFTSQLRAAANSSMPAGGMPTTYTTCIESDNAVPADLGPQCSLERHDRRGSQISWSMSCANTGVRAEGLAQYRGDTMQATVVSHIPAAAGRVTNMTQHLTGRHIGPCLPATAALPPTGTAAPISVDGSSKPPAAMSNVGSAAPAPATAKTSADASEQAPERHARARHHRRHSRYAHRSYHRHYGRAAYRAWYGGGSSFGPAPTSGAGP